MSIIESDPHSAPPREIGPRVQQSVPVSEPAYPPPGPRPPALPREARVRRRGSRRGAVILSILAAGIIVAGLAASVIPPSSPGHQFWTNLFGGGVAATPQATIQQVIQTANSEQSEALATNNPSVMSDTATAAYYRQLAQLYQQMAAQGATSIQLTNLTWGPVTVKGATATATTSETWLTTFSDGTTTESTDTNVYTLVQQNGTWLIEADQQPATPPASSTPAAPTAPQPQPTPPPLGSSANISHNWSGYAATGGTFTGVTGTWSVPQPSSSTTTSGVGATWVGIGGVNSQDLIQAGTQDVTVGGQHQFQTWIEMLPQASQQVALAVVPGDSITVSITESAPGSGQWTISMKNNTTGQSYQTSVQYQSSQSSAEWIEEAPATVSGNTTTIAPLDNFGTVSFSGDTAVENGQTVAIAQTAAHAITMANSSDQALAVPSAIGSDGTSFTVTRTSVRASSAPIGSGRGQRGGGTPPANGR